jgi:altered-inheritance-of-mitochondria protein 13
VVNQLSDHIASPETTPERQSSLDSHIRGRIQQELAHLRNEEENVRQQIESALEKENLDREREGAGDAADSEEPAAGDVKSSAALLGDLQEIQGKIDRFHTRRQLDDFESVKSARDEVTECYRRNPTTTLNCWQEVNKFKTSVSQLEQEYFKSLH